jgi:protein-L-isoaspartate(D-aspartate) O-methyltransferase
MSNILISVRTMENSTWQKLIDSLVKQGRLQSPNIIKVMRLVPRLKFLPVDLQLHSADDIPLQIGFGQTVSAPHMVSTVAEALQPKVGCRVLEVGAGSGWQASIIAELVAPSETPRSEWGHVYAVEIVTELAEIARRNVMNAGYGDRVTVISGDGSKGYLEKSPYDRIVVEAAAQKIPKPLLDQLKSGGVLVIPVGNATLFQKLMKVTKDVNGTVLKQNLGGVSFLPLMGEYGHDA